METLLTGAASPAVGLAAPSKAAASSAAGAPSSSDDAEHYVQVITASKEPFPIVWASEAWLKLSGYAISEVIGRTMDIIQGPRTTRESVAQLMAAIRQGESASLPMIHHTKSGVAFSHNLRIEPLRDSHGVLQCFQATSAKIEFLRTPLPTIPQSWGCGDATRVGVDLSVPSFARSREVRESNLSHVTHMGADGDGGEGSRSGFKRSASDLKINEMLDLFDAAEGSPALSAMKATSPRLPPLSEPAISEPPTRNHSSGVLTDDASVISAFLDLA